MFKDERRMVCALSLEGRTSAVLAREAVRIRFHGVGRELFLVILANSLLTVLSIGIYLPWAICRIAEYLVQSISIGPTAHGELRAEFNGSGSRLLFLMVMGPVVSAFTFCIMWPWVMKKFAQFFVEGIFIAGHDGTIYHLTIEGTARGAWRRAFLEFMLFSISASASAPWSVCRVMNALMGSVAIWRGGDRVGELEFSGRGGELLSIYLAGMVLVPITMGVYLFWFWGDLIRFVMENSYLRLDGRSYSAEFKVEGSELFVMCLWGYPALIITLFACSPWVVVAFARHHANAVEFREVGYALPS